MNDAKIVHIGYTHIHTRNTQPTGINWKINVPSSRKSVEDPRCQQKQTRNVSDVYHIHRKQTVISKTKTLSGQAEVSTVSGLGAFGPTLLA